MPASSLLLFVLGAASVAPQSVPARGAQEAIVTLDRAAMVRISTVNPQGTACVIVDHLRGPFASSGTAGRTNCDLDLLLDSGTYKLRLASPPKGKGTVSIKAEPFVELNTQLLRLEPGRLVEQKLKRGQQLSYWVHLDERRFVTLRASGRTAGAVRLWRSGEWVEAASANDSRPSPKPGQPIHEWWVQQWLEKGDYLFTVYGTDSMPWTRGGEGDTVAVAWGFAPAPEERTASVTIPAWGLAGFELPKEATAAFLVLPAATSASTDLMVFPQGDAGEYSGLNPETRCRVEPKALVPQCAVVATGDTRHVLAVRGAPGTRVELQWAKYSGAYSMTDGSYTTSAQSLSFEPPVSGEYLVATHDVPAEIDSAPLGCTLERHLGNSEWLTVAHDFPALTPGKTIERRFNYGGSDAAIWFEVPRGANYVITLGTERQARCELFRVQGDQRARLSETQPDGTPCRIERSLSPGSYELHLYGGDAGIETLRIAEVLGGGLFSGKKTESTEKATFGKTACVFPKLKLEKDVQYRIGFNRIGEIAARGLMLRPLPVALDRPLPIEVPAGATVTFPLSAGRPVQVRGVSTAAFGCALGGASETAREGACHLPQTGGKETLKISNPGAEPVAVLIQRPVPPRELPPLSGWSPTFPPLQPLRPDEPAFLQFAREESHSLVFDVAQAGLYHVTTEGLLTTDCAIRTPATPSLFSDSRSGRGRNCLVASYLRPGKYLVTVRTVGESRGRGAVVLTRRPARPGPDVGVDATAFYRVDAGDLVAEKLSVKKGGSFKLETFARNASLSCRLEDKDGWPLVTVPTPCSGTHALGAGDYLWMQLPLTVESMRRTRLERIRPELVLTGNKPHTLALNRWYSAKLGNDGKDEFLFAVEADLDVQVSLTDLMQGRLYRIEADGKETAVEVIAAREEAAPAPVADEYSEESEAPPPEYEEAPQEEGYEGESVEGDAPPPPAQPAYVQQPPSPVGQAIHLTAGRYRLVTEHSRSDVAIAYRVFVGSDTLTPGMSRDLSIPTKVPLRVSREGVLRLRTEGEADVRCRIFDARGRLVAESSEHGEDWNCALAEPIAAGEYQLDIESETLTPGSTLVSLSMPANEDAATLADGATLKLGAKVLSIPIPSQAEGVQEIDVRSSGAFSCALLDPRGAVLFRNKDGRDCAALLRQGGEGYRLRLWTPEKPTEARARLANRPVQALDGRIEAGRAGRATLERAGRYRTGHQVWCQPEAERGVLRPCGPEVSLEAGPVVFSAFGTGTEIKVSLDEVVASVASPLVEKSRVETRAFIGAERADGDAIHLLAVRGLSGERAAPACALEGGARLFRGADCFAATGSTRTALARWWSTEDEGDAEVTRRAIAFPKSAGALAAGEQELKWTGSAVRYGLPDQTFRLELLLPPSSWAVQLNPRGAAVDVCAPEAELSRCVLTGRGGEVVVEVAGEPRADATLITGEVPANATLFAGLFESIEREPGTLRIAVPSASAARELAISGARTCVIRLADGARVAGCRAAIPAGQGAEALVLHGGGALRAVAHATGALEATLFPGLPDSRPEGLAPANALALRTRTDRTLSLDKPAVVHIQADSGVCALVAGTQIRAVEGMGAGCRIHRILDPGAYRVVVRPFGSQPLAGSLWWTQTAVEPLGEGVGRETWTGPGQAHFYRFKTASQGRVGLGLQQPSETLSCAVLDANHKVLGVGCQQLLSLEAGTYLLEVRAPESASPTWFRPVLFGLAGASMGVPEEYLREFFNRIGGVP